MPNIPYKRIWGAIDRNDLAIPSPRGISPSSINPLMRKTKLFFIAAALAVASGQFSKAFAGEADINIPDLTAISFSGVRGTTILFAGLIVCALGVVFGLVQYAQTKGLPVHKSMGAVSNTIWETCKTYLGQQGKFLAILWGVDRDLHGVLFSRA